MKVPGLAGGVVLVAATLAAAAGPGVTCAGARPRSIEALICGSPLLAALDVDKSRLDDACHLGCRMESGYKNKIRALLVEN